MKSANFVLDTFAVLTYFKEESGWEKVKKLLWDVYSIKHTIYFNYVNLGELYYIVYREHGAVMANKVIALIKLWPIKLVEVDEELAVAAGRVKAENALSYADAFVAATALAKDAVILTGDPEFKPLEDIIDIYWLPKNR